MSGRLEYISDFLRKLCPWLLALLWITGLVCGNLAFYTSDSSYTSWMRNLSAQAVSIVDLMFVTLTPFLFSAIAGLFSAEWLLFPMCFVKGYSLAYTSCVIFTACQSGGWLIRFYLMFGSLISVPVLFYFWLFLLRGNQNGRRTATVLFLIFGLLLCCLEYRFFSPSLVFMIKYS